MTLGNTSINPMRRALAFIVGATPLMLCSGLFAATEKPNILFIIADQWRPQAFGFAGDPNVKTPHFDRFEKECANFINAVASIPVCSPTRAMLMTGQRALTNGVFLNDVPLSPDAPTVAKTLAKIGYDTGFIGKWHIDGHGRSNFIPRERRQGFDYWKVLECTHDYNNSHYYADGPEKLKWEGYDAIAQTKDAIQYMRDHAKASKSGKPFALYLAWGPPHDPYATAPKKYREMYDPAKISLRPNVPAGAIAKAKESAAGYYAHCSALDDCLGDLWKTLDDLGIDENTLIVFTADHGDLLGSHAAYHKQQPFDECARVPLLFRYPARLGRTGHRLPAPVDTPDIVATLYGLCGIETPKTVEGRDFSGYMTGGKDTSDGAAEILCPSPFGQWNRLVGGKEFRAVRTVRYTYVRDLKGPWMLFDNEKDPYQESNLVNKPEAADIQATLEALLQKKLKETADAFLPGTDYIKKWGYVVDAKGTVPYKN